MGGAGFEPVPENPGETADSDKSGAECGALPALSTITDPDLRHLIEAWPTLPESFRHAILTMAKAIATDIKPKKGGAK